MLGSIGHEEGIRSDQTCHGSYHECHARGHFCNVTHDDLDAVRECILFFFTRDSALNSWVGTVGEHAYRHAAVDYPIGFVETATHSPSTRDPPSDTDAAGDDEGHG